MIGTRVSCVEGDGYKGNLGGGWGYKGNLGGGWGYSMFTLSFKGNLGGG